MSNIHSTPIHVTPPSGVGASGEYWGSNGDGTSGWSIPTGDTFNPQYTLYWAVGGNDGHSGTIDFPFATSGQAVTAGQALITAGANFVQLIGLGIGTDTSNLAVTKSGLDIYAPGWFMNPPSGDFLTVTLGGGGSASYFNSLFQRVAVESGANAVHLVSTTVGNNNVTRFAFNGSTTGNVYLNVSAEYYTTIIGGTLTANQTATKVYTLYGIGSQTQATRLNLFGFGSGALGQYIHGPTDCSNIWRYPMRKVRQLSSDITLDSAGSGYLYVNSTSSTYTVTLPGTAGQDTPFLIAYETTFLNAGAGSIEFATSDSATLIGTTALAQVAQRANCSLIATDTWEVDVVVTGSGTVDPGTTPQLAYYATTGSTVSGLSTAVPIAQGGTAVTSVTTTPTASAFAGWDVNENLSANGVIEGITITAVSSGTTTLTVASTKNQYFTGTTGQTIVMPVASSLVVGQQFVITSSGTANLVVQSSGANTIATIYGGNTRTFTCVLNSGTTAASWFTENTVEIVTAQANYMAYYLTADVIGGINTADNSVLATSASGAPFMTTTLPTAVQTNITHLGAVAAGSLTTGFTTIAPAQGGTGVTSIPTAPAATAFAAWDANKNMSANSFIPGYTTTATSGGSTTLTVTSTQLHYFTGSSGQILVMPVTSTLVLGQSFTIVNRSTGIITVESSGGGTIYALPSMAEVIVTCISLSGTTAASWNYAASISPAANGTIYFSQTSGNDANPGFLLSPVATPTQAIVLSETHSPAWAIECLDAGTYGDNLTFTSVTSFFAPGATFNGGGGDTFTFNNSNPLFLTVGSFANSNGFNAITCNAGAAYTVVNTYFVNDGAIVNTGGNNLVINANAFYEFFTSIDISNTNGSYTFFNCNTSFGISAPGDGFSFDANTIVGMPGYVNSKFNGTIYFSQTSGNDYWPGTLTQPVATPTQGLVLSEALGCSLVCLDNSNYTDTLTLINTLTFWAPYAVFSQSSGDNFTIGTSGTGQYYIKVRELYNFNGPNIITVNADSQVRVETNTLQGGGIVNNSCNNLVIDADWINPGSVSISNPNGNFTYLNIGQPPGGVLSIDSTTIATYPGSVMNYDLSISMIGYQYFNQDFNLTAATVLIPTPFLVPTDSLNGADFAGPSNRSYGSLSFYCSVPGVYTFAIQYATQSNQGIMTFAGTGPTSFTQAIDCYSVSTNYTFFQWQETLAVGLYSLELSTFTKNASSTDYWISPASTLYIRYFG